MRTRRESVRARLTYVGGLRALAGASDRTVRRFWPSFTAVVIAACSGTGAPPPDDGDPTTPPAASTWSKSLGGANDDWANAVIATRDGGYLLAGVLNHQQVTGASAVGTVEGDFWVAKLDSLGDPVWQQVVGEQRSVSGDALVSYRRVRAGSSGYWMVGTRTIVGASGVPTNPDAQVDLQVARLDDSGTVLWTQAYDSGLFDSNSFFVSGASARDHGWDIAPMADGGALAVAWSSAILRADATNGVPAASPWVVRLSSTGEIRWQRRLSGTQYDYIADEPAELLVRESAGRGAIVAASARLRGSDPDPAVQLSLLQEGGAVSWTQRYSRMLVRDLIQAAEVVEDQANDGIPDDHIVLAGEDFGVRFFGRSSDDDDDTIVMKINVGDGTEEWRQVMDDGVKANSISQQCRQRPDATWLCYYIVAGSGRVDDEGAVKAMVVRLSADGSRDSHQFFDGLESAFDIEAAPESLLTVSTPVVIIGRARLDSVHGARGFRMTMTPTLNEIDRQFTSWGTLSNSWAFNDELHFHRDGRVLATSVVRGGLALRSFAVDAAPVFSREYGGISERRGERAFDAIEVTGGYIVAGQADSSGADAEHPSTLVTRLDTQGRVSWQSTLSDFSLVSLRQIPYEAMAESGDGGLVVVGAQGQSGSGSDLIRAARLDANGNVIWVSVPLNLSNDFLAYASSVQRASDGGFFVAGGMYVNALYDDNAWLTSIDTQGAVRWQRRLTGGVRITSLRALPDGGAVLAGLSLSEGPHRPWAARVDATGLLLWSQVYSAQSADSDPVARIALAADGGFLIATSHLVTDSYNLPTAQAAAGRRNALLIRLNPDGTARWHRIYGGLLDETIYGLDSTSDGGFVVAGRSDSLGERGEAWVMRLGPDGLINAGCNALLDAPPGTNYAAVDSQVHAFSGTGYPSEMIAGSMTTPRSNFPA
ncbi:MAG TPA: hypothetical protein VFS58_00110, partial [Steroidobacteraceae bacterium]|nr:hypothetical protein [Steroidobacteraceae bacterium]